MKQLVTHRGGETLSVILQTLDELGYNTSHRVLNALDYGLPQRRERVFIVGRRKDCGAFPFAWPEQSVKRRPLNDLLEESVADRYRASAAIRSARQEKTSHHVPSDDVPLIFHENKSGHVSAYPYACALRAGSSHNYLLVNGERRLTEREMLRLQGFPDNFVVTGSYTQTRRQVGNAVPVNLVTAVASALLPYFGQSTPQARKNARSQKAKEAAR